MRKPSTRVGIALATAALGAAAACGTYTGSAGGGEDHGSAGPDTDSASVEQATTWLLGQLQDDVFQAAFQQDGKVQTSADYGGTLDLALALAAVDRTDEAEPLVSAVAEHADSYVQGPGQGKEPDRYAGSTAKALAVTVELGGDPTDFGGIDLVAQLEDLTTDDGPAAGRIADASSFGDYANTFGQAYAVQGLHAVGSEEAEAATDFLLQQQCSDGYFRLYFAKDATAEDQGCQDGDDKTSPPDPDSTSTAILALRTIEDPSPEVTEAIESASAWLLDQQEEDGSFPGGVSTPDPNANSTGLAARALGELGETEAATAAGDWLVGLQLSAECLEGAGGKAAEEAGAVGYTPDVVATARKQGIDQLARSQWFSATVQALPALGWASEAEPGCAEES